MTARTDPPDAALLERAREVVPFCTANLTMETPPTDAGFICSVATVCELHMAIARALAEVRDETLDDVGVEIHRFGNRLVAWRTK